MELNYIRSESTVKPSTLTIEKKTVYIRTDIKLEERTDPFGNKVKFWVYQEAKLTPEEFDKYSNEIVVKNAVDNGNNSENIAKIIDGQEVSDNYQLAIMEAIADLYDAIATII